MSKAVSKKVITPELYDIVEFPIVTEKSQAGSESNKVTFRVADCANKTNVKRAVEAVFGVSVEKVNIIVTKGKTKVFRGRPGRRKDVKKAIVTLAEGQTIDMASAV
jgi:large subunit ribosomal protein L23